MRVSHSLRLMTLLTWSWTSRLVCCELFVSRSLHSRRTAHTYMLSLSRSRCLSSPQSGFLDVDTKSAPLPAPGTAPHTSILEALARCASALATVCGVCSVLCGRWGSRLRSRSQTGPHTHSNRTGASSAESAEYSAETHSHRSNTVSNRRSGLVPA